jgi:hypothetical protein
MFTHLCRVGPVGLFARKIGRYSCWSSFLYWYIRDLFFLVNNRRIYIIAVFEAVDCKVKWLLSEGTRITPSAIPSGKVIVAEVTGKCRNILIGERTALNIITRASGIATQASAAVKVARDLGWKGHVAGTRKTTPGFRIVEKYALLIAGASTHRHDVSQMVMLKGNLMDLHIYPFIPKVIDTYLFSILLYRR